MTVEQEEKKLRSEQEILDELATICQRPGFAHAIAMFCFRDNIVGYSEELKGGDYAKMFSPNRLIRTEMSTLIGLMVRNTIDWAKPSNDQMQEMLKRAEELLQELHRVLNLPGEEEFKALAEAMMGDEGFNPFKAGSVLREPIFYAAESAYASQYRDFAVKKYGADDDWLNENQGFTVGDASKIVSSLLAILEKKLLEVLKKLKGKAQEEWTLLPGFQFTAEEVVAESKVDEAIVRKVLEAFCLKDQNPTFTSLNAFNATNAFPLLKSGEGQYTLFQYVALAESLYESPFFWMLGDKKYQPTATANRGRFVEALAAECLEKVFGAPRVFKNVDIWRSRGEKIGEIDVLVLFADRAIVLQAKSKKLTLAARHGSDPHIQEDFKAAVQDACDQAFTCAEELVTGKCSFTDEHGQAITLPKEIKQVFPVCIVSDHYPALSFQAQQFLKYKTTEKIVAPLVSDVFMLDVMTEFLDTPLRCLSYLDLRARAGDNVMSSHEITTLAYHLKRNLWLGEYDFMQLHDDISVDVDIAMAVRRDGVDGEKTPRGILTFLEGRSLGKIIEDLNAMASPWATAAGLELLKLGSEAAGDLCTAIDRLADQATRGKNGSSSLAFSKEKTGLTIQCNNEPTLDAVVALKQHCEVRKYGQKAASWVGLLIEPGTGKLRHCLVLDAPWKEDPELAKAAARLTAAQPVQSVKEAKKILSRYKRGKES
jgi:hypothetical protein